MTCNRCGANVQEGTRFCTKCGAPMENLINTEQKSGNKGLLITLVVLVGVAVLIGSIAVVLGVYNCTNGKDENVSFVEPLPEAEVVEEAELAPEETVEANCETLEALELYESLGYDNIINYEYSYGYTNQSPEPEYYTFTYPDVYSCPIPVEFNKHPEDTGYSSYETYSFIPLDNTAVIQLRCTPNTGVITPKEMLNRKKMSSTGSVGYCASGESWYVFSVDYDGILVYEKCIMTENEVMFFVMAFPKEFQDTYDGYIEYIEDNFGEI